MRDEIITGINQYGEFVEKHLPTILTGLGTILFGATIIEAVEKAPEVKEEVLKRTDEKGEGLTPLETAGIAVKGYRRPIIFGLLSLTCFYGAQGINSKRILALASAYSMKDVMLNDYKKGVEAIVGKNKSEKAKIEAEKAVTERAVKNNTPIMNARYGDDLFYIPSLGIMFRGDMEHVKQAFDEADSYMSTNDEVTVNYLLEKIGLMPMRSVGDKLGWKLERVFKSCGYNPAKCKIPRTFDSILIDDRPYAVIDIEPEPLFGYDIYDNQYRY